MAGNNNRDPRSRRESIQEGVIKQLKEFQTSFTESFKKTFNDFNKDLSDILVQNLKGEREVNKSEQRTQRDILNDLRVVATSGFSCISSKIITVLPGKNFNDGSANEIFLMTLSTSYPSARICMNFFSKAKFIYTTFS